MRDSPHLPIGLYVHVPFCVKKCTYCDFATWAGRENEIPRYVDAVIGEITRRGEATGHPKADTIFLGGGTPSLLDEDQITRVLEASMKHIRSKKVPRSLAKQTRKRSRSASRGRRGKRALTAYQWVQSKQANLLQILGRIHNWERVISAVDILRKAGFDNYNIDLMFGLPSQTVADVRETLAAALHWSPRISPATV